MLFIMMMVMMLFLMVVTAAALMLLIMVMVMMLFLMVVTTAALMLFVMMMVMMLFLVVVAAAALMLLIMVMVMLFVMMATAALVFLIMVMVVCVLQFLQLLSQRMLALHGLQKLLTRELAPGRGHQCGSCVMLPEQCHSSIQLSLRNGIGTGQDDGTGGFHLIVIELTEVLHVDLDLTGIYHSHGVAQLNAVARDLLNSSHHIGQLTDTGGLDDDPVGVILLDDLGQRLAEVAHQAAANAAGVHFSDVDAGVLQEAAVNADLTEFIFDEDQLFAAIGFLDHFLDQRGLACAEETGININFHG